MLLAVNTMNLNEDQFGELARKPMKLNKEVTKSYPTLSEYLNMELKQKKLMKGTCYPWKINCNTTPTLKQVRKANEFR
jgi:hypothetical protein